MTEVLFNHIDPEAIVLGIEAEDRETVIRLLAEKLHRNGHVRDGFAEAVIAREAKMPTGLPLGRAINVAIPHTDPEHVLRPRIAIATLARPVVFANMEDPGDDVPVGLVFLLALNDKDRQIEMLQEIMATIQSEDKVASLMRATSVEEVVALLK